MATPETTAGNGPDEETAGEEAVEERKRLELEVQVEKPSACERHITVTIPREDLDRYLAEAFDELMPTAAVPGFRPGRAPRKLVENRFRKEVAEQVKSSLLMDSISQVTEEEDFSAISEPNFDYEAVEVPDEGAMKFEFDLEVRPDFDMPQWKGLKLQRPVREYGPEDIDQHLKKMLRRHAEMVEKDGPVAAGDFVTVDIVFTKDGQTISDLPDETLCTVPVVSFFDGKLSGFDKLMEGAVVGDVRETAIRISPDAFDENLRGEEVTATFKVREVLEMELPELDAAMLDRLGEFDSEGDLRDGVKQHLERQLKYHQNQSIRQQISDMLTESADWSLPPDLLRRQSQRELHRAVLELRSSGFSDEEIRTHEAELRQNSRESTAKALKEHFILERIAEDQQIEAEPSDYDDEILLIARQRGENPRRIRAQLEKQDLMDTLRNQIIERKVVSLIESEAEFIQVPYAPETTETEAVEHFIAGEPKEEIPQAKHGEEESLRQPVERA